MRRAIKERLSGFLDDPEKSDEQRPMTDRMRDFVRDKGTALVTTVQEHLTSMTDTTGTLAKQKLLQTLLSTGKIQSEHIRHGLQIGIGHFLDPSKTSSFNLDNYLQRQRFPSVGGVTPPHNQADFDIEAHGLGIFLALMQIYGIDCSTLRDQVCRGELKEIVNPSSSGSLLYLTSDSGYLIKTLRDYDAKLIQQRFLQAYYQYVQQRPDTFLAKLFGVFGYVPYLSSQHNITVDSFTLRFAIFANFVPVNLDIHEKYDLKGSTYRRDADIKERMKSSTTFKDNDFRDLHPNGLRIPRQVYEHLTEVLARDVDFLQSLNIMDYSLLLIVHNIDNPVKVVRPGSLEALMGAVGDRFLIGMNELKEERQRHNEQRRSSPRLRFKKPMETLGFRYEEMPMFDVDYAKEYGGIPAINEKDERLLLFVGIIDILQTFDICKVMQRQYQTVENRDVVAERSIVEPDFYARRFRQFIFNQVFRPVDSVPAPARASIYPSLLFPF